ncbi:MAG: hypothetical protein HY701_04845 [Gemmatimonadetes bacterium]|nr:hypothetical protein [Gemmatimonadota bacterium]
MPQQVTRLIVLFAAGVVAILAARRYLVPPTFGEIGHYRAAAVDSIVARKKKYAGHQECALCHDRIAETRLSGHHRGVACEVCHGPAAAHVATPLDVKPTAPRERGLCPLCHAYNPSRPTGFPQIDSVAHNPLIPCIGCHDPHQPEPPIVPEECSACHGQISRQKAVSRHVRLPCTTCHATPEEHKTLPRRARPEKPTERAFCGACHAEDAPSPSSIPRIDLQTHGEQYLCWDCHYPHYPEAR